MNKLNEIITNYNLDEHQFQDIYFYFTNAKLSDEELQDFKATLIPKLYKLFKEGSIRKDILFLSLLGNTDHKILSQLVDYEINQPLQLHNGMSLFVQCYYQGKNWFESILRESSHNAKTRTLLKCFEANLQNDIKIFEIIKLTNENVIDIEVVQRLLNDIDIKNVHDEFICVYINEIKYILNVLSYCKQNGNAICLKLSATHLFHLVNKSKLLALFSEYLPLEDIDKWEEVLSKLKFEAQRFEFNQESDTISRDIDEFNCYLILANIIKSLRDCKRIGTEDNANGNGNQSNIMVYVNDARDTLESLNPKLTLQILEDVFTLCFLKEKHFITNNDHNHCNDSFIHTDKELRLLLYFLRPCLDELNSKIPIRTNEYSQLQLLNRHVKEALWRLEMLDDLDSFNMSHMLADSETLIQTSLKKGRFDKAHQVIQIFSLENTQLAQEILHTEKLLDLRTSLQQAFKLQKLQKEMTKAQNISSPQTLDRKPARILNEFLEKHKTNLNQNDLIDMAFIATMSHDNTKDVLECMEFSTEFKDKLTVLINSINNCNLKEILNSPKYDLNVDAHNTKLQFYNDLDKTIKDFYCQLNTPVENHAHLVYKSYAELKQMAGIKDVKEINYFHRLFNYLKLFLRVFNTEGNNTDLITRGNFISYFKILDRSRSDWIGNLIFERNLDPRDFEHLFVKLKSDLLYTTATNCFPKIALNNNNVKISASNNASHIDVTNGNDSKISLDNLCTFNIEPKLIQEPTKVVFTYIAKRNWLLAFIINEIYGLAQMDVNETRTKYFSQYVNTSEVNNLKIFYDNNKIITALHQDYYDHCIEYLKKIIFESEKTTTEPAVEAAEEISEEKLKSKWMNVLLLIDSLPESKMCAELDDLRDRVLVNLISDTFHDNSYMYIKYVKNDEFRWKLILEHFINWPGEFCISLLKGEHNLELLKWSEKIQFCEDIKDLFNLESWFEVHKLSLINPSEVYSKLLNIPKASLLLTFQKFYNAESLLSHIPTSYIASLFTCGENLNNIKLLLNNLENPIRMCLELVEIVRNLNQLQFIIEYLEQSGYGDENWLKNVRISSKILNHFQVQDREQLWCLINTPLVIIEMLVMNTKLDKLGVILESIRNDVENCEFNENVISLEGIDEILRKYAEKSLDIRIILEPHPSLLKGSEGKLMESLDSIYGPDRKHFVMPEVVPSKSEWIPNDQVLECMCCQNTTFSMFNRRHHCRRCGRVICFNCSTKRILVPTYGDILVRVCLDCFDQSKYDTKSDSTSNKSVVYDYWLLSDCNEHNTIVRQEFSYEHAPSVSLCLSIMKYHTKTYAYPKFLLDQCDAMLKLLQPPGQNAPQEVDYMLVIKMLKSLAIAAKMISSECQLPWGSSQADRILSQADLFALLAERGCLNLLPPSSSGAPYVDALILRKLRDKLLMQEQWHFALDVSTKAGLENAGVFASWGKSCLKAGCLQMAREKFQRCFDKSGHFDSLSLSVDEDSNIDGSSIRSKYSRISVPSESKPPKNPAILEQIIEILESKTISFTNYNNPNHKSNNKDNSNAVLIKAKLKHLKAIANGNIESKNDYKGCNLDPVYFQECLYYLKKYGSHLGLLQFYLKHNCFKETLIYMFDNNVSIEIFIEVYIICLRDGKINNLQKGMSRIDSTLEIWKDYLRGICRHLEKQGLLNSLYQLQQFMVDYVRASMTCIRFYKDVATSYQALAANIHFLEKAEAHLIQELEQQQWVEVNAVASTITSDSSFEEKPALSNPSLVMKMDSKIIDQHIRTIKRQKQITKFLARCEKSDYQLLQLLPHITPNIEGESNNKIVVPKQLPTLFDSQNEKVQLAVMLIICGDKIQDGYDLALSIIQDYKLKALKVYCQAGRQLAREDRYNEIAELVNCIRSKGSNEPAITSICDEMLTLAVRTLNRNDVPTSQLEVLIKLITDRATKISIYIETKQLKSAYLLAAKYNRFGDIRRILREAELINKQDIKKLCQKLLQVHSHSKD